MWESREKLWINIRSLDICLGSVSYWWFDHLTSLSIYFFMFTQQGCYRKLVHGKVLFNLDAGIQR